MAWYDQWVGGQGEETQNWGDPEQVAFNANLAANIEVNSDELDVEFRNLDIMLLKNADGTYSIKTWDEWRTLPAGPPKGPNAVPSADLEEEDPEKINFSPISLRISSPSEAEELKNSSNTAPTTYSSAASLLLPTPKLQLKPPKR